MHMSNVLRKLLQQVNPEKNVLDTFEKKYKENYYESRAKKYISKYVWLADNFFEFLTKHGLDIDLLLQAADQIKPHFEKNKQKSFQDGLFPTLRTYQKVQTNVVGSQSFNMVFCLSDSFYMGSIDATPDDSGRPDQFKNVYPRKNILLTRDFLLGETEVTVDLWCEVMGGDVRTDEEKALWKQIPMHSITWYDAISFCNRLSERQGLEKAYVMSNIKQQKNPHISNKHKCGMLLDSIEGADVLILSEAKGYRLPTSAEWEYAARSKQVFNYSGSVDFNKVAWCGKITTAPQPVKWKLPNAWGLYDMSGNVAEWCNDCVANDYGSDLKAKRQAYKDLTRDPISWDSSLQFRVVRGGAVGIPEDCSRLDREAYLHSYLKFGSYMSGGDLSYPIGMRVLRYI